MSNDATEHNGSKYNIVNSRSRVAPEMALRLE
jgi:plasmid maintenance system antidote protein VapI